MFFLLLFVSTFVSLSLFLSQASFYFFSVKSLKQLSLLAFVKAVECKQFRGDGGYLEVALGEPELLRAVVALLSRRRQLSSSALRPFLHAVASLDLSAASPLLNLAATLALAPHLSSLALRGRLSDAAVSALPSSLTVLDCSCCPRLSQSGLLDLARACPRLVSLHCGWSSNLSSLDPLAQLEHLVLLDAGRLLALQGSQTKWPPRLRKLVLGGCASLERLAGWPETLEQLEISDCTALRYCEPLPKLLRELAAARCPIVCDEWLDEVTAACSQLTWLDVSGTAVKQAAWKHANLQSLLLERCSDAVLFLSKSAADSTGSLLLSQLSVLSLSGCASFDFDQLSSARMLPALSSLCLSSTSVSDSQLVALLRVLPLLRLDVSFCQQISDEVLSSCENLLLLRIYGCENVTLPALKKLAAKCPNLRICAPTSE